MTLTCSSDANPAANYTWYKEDENTPKASGQIFTITDIRSEHSGNYYCEAQNTRGRQNSTLYGIVVSGKSYCPDQLIHLNITFTFQLKKPITLPSATVTQWGLPFDLMLHRAFAPKQDKKLIDYFNRGTK